MKTLKVQTGGHRIFYNDDVTHLSESIEETANAWAKLLGDNFYLTHTVITNNAGFYQCAAGCMVYKGELCYFDAQNVAVEAGKTLCWVPVVTYRINPVIYADSSNQMPHVTKKIKLEMVNMASPPADYMAFNEFLHRGTAILNTFKAQFTQIGQGGTLKTVEWDNANLPNNAWIRRNVIVDALSYSLEYELKGSLVGENLTLDVHDPIILFTVPAALQPERELVACVPVVIKTNAESADDTYHTAVCKLTTDGDFIVYAPAGVVVGQKMLVYFDGLVLHEHSFIL